MGELYRSAAKAAHGALLTISALVAAGCGAPPPVWDRATTERYTVRTFDGVTKAQAMDAAERVMRLADPDDVTVSYQDDAIVMDRAFEIFAVISAANGKYRFQLATTQENESAPVRARVAIYMDMTTTIPVAGATLGGGIAVAPMSSTAMSGEFMPTGPAYDLFWNRVAYMLGQSDVWESCDAYAARNRLSGPRDNLQPMCLYADDNPPS